VGLKIAKTDDDSCDVIKSLFVDAFVQQHIDC
jgi:hypothetical protein